MTQRIKSEWILTSKRLPEINRPYTGVDVIVYNKESDSVYPHYYRGKDDDKYNKYDWKYNITHWMYAPELPLKPNITETKTSKLDEPCTCGHSNYFICDGSGKGKCNN